MRNRLTNELAVCGFNAVKALADKHAKRINRLFLREEHLKAFGKVCKQLAEIKHPYKVCDDEELERLCQSPRHQGVVAMISEPIIPSLTEKVITTWAEAGETILVLASVGNDNNLGAIVRSAAFFGIRKIALFADDGEARLTTSAYRVAEGGMEYVEFFSAADPVALLRLAAENAVVIGAAPRARAKLQELRKIIAAEKTKRLGAASLHRGLGGAASVFVVMGNEERGLSEEVTAVCTSLVRISGTGNIESLNVAQAANLFLYELYERS